MDEKKGINNKAALEPAERVKYNRDGNTGQRKPSMGSSDDNAIHTQDGGMTNERGTYDKEQIRHKIAKILRAAGSRNYDKLASLATSYGGFVDDETRRVACAYSRHKHSV